MISTATRTQFHERLARIEADHARAKGAVTLQVGEQTLRVRSLKDVSMKTVKRPEQTGVKFSIGRILPAFALGCAAVAGTIIAQERLVPMLAEEGTAAALPQLGLGAMAVAAFALSYLVSIILRLHGKALGLVQLAAVLLALSAVHNLAYLAPEAARMAFSPDWVETQLASSAPNTLVLAGYTYTF